MVFNNTANITNAANITFMKKSTELLTRALYCRVEENILPKQKVKRHISLWKR